MLQLTTNGRADFLDGIQGKIAAMALVDADGQEIDAWQLGRLALYPESWDGERYIPNPEADPEEQGVFFYPRATRADEPAVVVGGVIYLNGQGQTLAYEPLVTPLIVSRQGQVIHLRPALRIFGTFRSEL